MCSCAVCVGVWTINCQSKRSMLSHGLVYVTHCTRRETRQVKCNTFYNYCSMFLYIIKKHFVSCALGGPQHVRFCALCKRKRSRTKGFKKSFIIFTTPAQFGLDFLTFLFGPTQIVRYERSRGLGLNQTEPKSGLFVKAYL